jgi:hypothetical protein
MADPSRIHPEVIFIYSGMCSNLSLRPRKTQRSLDCIPSPIQKNQAKAAPAFDGGAPPRMAASRKGAERSF